MPFGITPFNFGRFHPRSGVALHAATLLLAAHGAVAQTQPAAPAAVPPSTPATTTTTTKPEPAPAVTPSKDPIADRTTPPAAQEGEEADMVLHDGRTISGTLIKRTQTSVVFSVGGVPTTFDMQAIERIVAVPPVEERYKAIKASIDPADAQGLMRLAEWLRAHQRCDLAMIEVENALVADPGNPDARALKLLISEQQKVEEASRKAKEKKQADQPVGRTPEPASHAAKPAAAFPLLTDEQINVIRVYEVDLNAPPKMVIAREVVEQFLSKYAGQRPEGRETIPGSEQGRKIYATRKPVEMLTDMFALKAREFYPQVKVLENPQALQLFRDNVNRTWLVNSCATSKCHGGEEAGRLMLYDRKPASDVAAYTNFLILERFSMAGANGKDPVALINYNEPAQSPLLQLGLPRAEAKFKHPDLDSPGKPRWRPVFRSEQDERFQQAVTWIKSMYGAKDGKRPVYPVEYAPPQPSKAHEATPEPGR
jgi:hypothetical protein